MLHWIDLLPIPSDRFRLYEVTYESTVPSIDSILLDVSLLPPTCSNLKYVSLSRHRRRCVLDC